MQKLNNSEIKVTEVVSFILEQFRNEKVKHDLEVTSELILIARILHQRFKINNGLKIKEDKSVILARDEVLEEIKNDPNDAFNILIDRINITNQPGIIMGSHYIAKAVFDKFGIYI